MVRGRPESHGPARLGLAWDRLLRHCRGLWRPRGPRRHARRARRDPAARHRLRCPILDRSPDQTDVGMAVDQPWTIERDETKTLHRRMSHVPDALRRDPEDAVTHANR